MTQYKWLKIAHYEIQYEISVLVSGVVALYDDNGFSSPDFSVTTLEFPDFSRWVVTLYPIIRLTQWQRQILKHYVSNKKPDFHGT